MENVVYSYNHILYSNGNKTTTTCNNMSESQKLHADRKTPAIKEVNTVKCHSQTCKSKRD